MQFGQTPNQLIREHKLLKAKQLLDKNPSLSIGEVAEEVGFKNVTYLKKRFKTRFEK